jgi:histidyl-tRNA synthetase
LSKESAQYFEKVQKGLSLLNIDFKLNQKLVRGLDYYTHTAFEFTTPHLGAQATILAGGRYNGLMKELGGPDISGIGFAIGVDRILDLPCKLENQKQLTVYLMSLSEAEFETLFVLSQKLKESPVTAVTCFSYNLSKNLKKAHKEGAHFALILGEDELKQNKVLVKNLDLGTQELVCLESLSSYLLKN